MLYFLKKFLDVVATNEFWVLLSKLEKNTEYYDLLDFLNPTTQRKNRSHAILGPGFWTLDNTCNFSDGSL